MLTFAFGNTTRCVRVRQLFMEKHKQIASTATDDQVSMESFCFCLILFCEGSNFATKVVFVIVLEQVLKVLEGHSDQVPSVAISSDGSKIVSGSWDKTVRIWSVETGQVHALIGDWYLAFGLID